MRHACQITLADIESFLRPEKGWQIHVLDGHKEFIADYYCKATPGAVVRVYTSVHVDTKRSRGIGQDAIRVCGIDLSVQGGRGLVKSAYVQRISTWRENLKARVTEVLKTAMARKRWLDGSKPPKIPVQRLQA